MAEQTLHSQMKDERAYYLGKLGPNDKVPGSQMTLQEARDAYRKGVKEEDARMEAKRQEYLKANPAPASTITTAVTVDTIRDIVLGDVAVTASKESSDAENLKIKLKDLIGKDRLVPADLKGLDKGELVAVAEGRGINVAPDSQNKDEIVAAILGG